MTVTFVSNYINHHQIPFSNACYALWGEDYHFVQTQPMEKERLSMGWSSAGEELPYVHCLYEEEERCKELILDSDVLLAGWSGREDLVQERMRAGKLTIRISERIYREGQWKAVSPKGLVHKYREHIRFRKSPAYLLCAGAYVPSDFHLIHAYPDKMFKWGYFTELRTYTEEELLSKKAADGSVDIVFAGRFIPLKHPEYMIELAKDLKALQEKSESGNSSFAGEIRIHMVGSGELEEELKAKAREYGVEDMLTFYGFQTPEQVRDIMEKCHIHIFTSNHLEGWGAVVNEAMNSGCAEVANVQAGAIPYLIRQGENGIAYPDNSYEEMKKAVIYLLKNPVDRERMGIAAYQTIAGSWNASYAANELSRMITELKTGTFTPAKTGPLSPAPVISPKNMFHFMLEEKSMQEDRKKGRV